MVAFSSLARWSLAALLTITAAARAQDITATGVARSASALYLIRTVCAAHVRVRLNEAEKVNGHQLEYGILEFGQQRMRDEMANEMPRRRNELLATGERAWCVTQRNSMTAQGLGFIFE